MVERLQAEPRVRSVAVAGTLPRMDHRSLLIEIEGTAASEQAVRTYVHTARVDVDYLAVLGRPVLAGRGFRPGDARAPESPVIVNTVFVERLLGGHDPIGRRLRFVTSDEGAGSGWHEIVGIIGHLGANIVNPAGDAALYVPAAAGTIHPLRLAIHLDGPPETFAPRLREIVTAVDRDAILAAPVVLDEVVQGDWYFVLAVAGGLVLLVVVLTSLAASGLYAMLSFSISERTREIGIRSALGARRRTLLLAILRRSLTQIALGALLGMPLAARIFFEIREDSGGEASAGVALLSGLALAVGIVAVIGVFSCLVPARRALRIHPGEALRT